MKADYIQLKVNELLKNIESLNKTIAEKEKNVKTRVSKSVTVNLGNYESLKLGVEDAASYDEADAIILAELQEAQLPVTARVRQCLGMRKVSTLPLTTINKGEVQHDEP